MNVDEWVDGCMQEKLRSALAMATTLNRTLVIPKFRCLLDRWWAPHRGRIPGADGPGLSPFVCPLDHVLDLEQMTEQKPEQDFGPHIYFREHSFLSRPEMKDAVQE